VANRLLSPVVKENSSHILYSRLNRVQLGSLYDCVTGMDKAAFIRFSESATHDYTFVVIDQTTNSHDPAEFLTLIRAKTL
jgi:hypothetical protein